MLRNPFCGGIVLLDLGREDCVRDRRIFDENGRCPGTHHQVTNETLVVLEVTGDPDTAMNEEKDWRISADLLWLHDVKFYGLAILRDGLFRDTDPGKVNRCLCLQAGQDGANLRSRHFPERTAVLVDFRKKGPDSGVDLWVCRRIRRCHCCLVIAIAPIRLAMRVEKRGS